MGLFISFCSSSFLDVLAMVLANPYMRPVACLCSRGLSKSNLPTKWVKFDPTRPRENLTPITKDFEKAFFWRKIRGPWATWPPFRKEALDEPSLTCRQIWKFADLVLLDGKTPHAPYSDGPAPNIRTLANKHLQLAPCSYAFIPIKMPHDL